MDAGVLAQAFARCLQGLCQMEKGALWKTAICFARLVTWNVKNPEQLFADTLWSNKKLFMNQRNAVCQADLGDTKQWRGICKEF